MRLRIVLDVPGGGPGLAWMDKQGKWAKAKLQVYVGPDKADRLADPWIDVEVLDKRPKPE